MARRNGREHWKLVVGRFERSGLTQAAFCKRERVSLGTFQKWLYKLRKEPGAREKRGRRKTRPAFVEIKSIAAQTTHGVCRLHLSGVELTFSELPAPEYVAELVRHAGRERR